MNLIISDTAALPFQLDANTVLIAPTKQIRPCIGCFSCWAKTPGKCVIKDGFELTGAQMGACTRLLIVSKCVYGSASPFVKNVMDRSISYIHPDFVIRNGEMHHKRRYQNHIVIDAWFYGEGLTEREKKTAQSVIHANALNFDATVGQVAFFETLSQMGGQRL